MDGICEEKLIQAAAEAMKNAYCIISDFPVGAAVLTTKGNIYKGCNTESVISGMGVCAERSAIDNAVAHGEYCFTALAVTSNLVEPIKPCGMCRQYIGEFSQVVQQDIEVIMSGSEGELLRSSIRKLYPDSFGPEDLGVNLEGYRNR
ncbi:MAG: cytidine deaminase [Francisellaceae bacterium]|jgi:cytidine deaminase